MEHYMHLYTIPTTKVSILPWYRTMVAKSSKVLLHVLISPSSPCASQFQWFAKWNCDNIAMLAKGKFHLCATPLVHLLSPILSPFMF
jgi:hypothetical protein